MLKNKFNLDQPVRVRVRDGYKIGKVVGMSVSSVRRSLIYEVIGYDANGFFKVHVGESSLSDALNYAPKNKVYDSFQSRAKLEELIDENIPTLEARVLKIEITENTVKVHFTKKNEFNPIVVTSVCHQDDKFDENKGITACILKYNIKRLQEQLNNL